ncbi:HTH domain-containing protein [uncultured Allomuricauda sp.]|uniref:HTH domain-containing protein n=1 Tax=Flagellimonas sp. W118 TaxID=3410791 RepID=UPI0026366053|nr:HTH domain-containing protein [uncultured Allomuricauda sp.]
MSKLTRQIAILERVHQLIRLKATGSPKQLAEKLGVSEATVFRMIDTMKEMKAPIYYNLTRQSYIYTETTYFKCGFYAEELDSTTKRNLSGGCCFTYIEQLVKF